MSIGKKLGYLAATAMLWGGVSLSAQAASTGDLWNGFYAGVQLGYDTGDTNMPWTNTKGGPFTNDDGPVGIDGFGGGVALGYNVRFNAFVLGLEGDIEYSNLNGNDNGRGGDVNELEANWMGSLRLRAGYAFDRALVYVTGGYAWMDADGNDKDIPDSVNYSLKGSTWGAGVEYAFTDRLSGRIEYRRTNFDSERQSYQCAGFCYDLAVDPEIDSYRVGVNYRL